ncbi:TNF superfamily member 12 eiger isoform X1 [Bombus fervidus]|uniref:TNF superfamily member 12 eiger isoform X1 n=2 Tax=Bombus fervidus TaxID=203811 RepID=UPI003AB6B346
MTSMLCEEDSKVARMKQKLMNDVHVKEETRSFLSVFRENLSISPSDLEQGFNKHRFRPNRNTILSVTALLIALLCLSLESWKFHCSLINAREIEELKRSVESLKHRFVKEDLLNELKAFEEQLYTEMYNDDDDDPDEADIDNADYDSNYDDDTFSSHDYSPVFGTPSDFPDSSSTIAPVPSPTELSADKTLLKLAAAHKVEVKYNQEPMKSYKNVDRERHQEKKVLEGKLENHENNTKRKRDVLGTDNVKDRFLSWKMSLKRKRSIDEENHNSKRSFVRRHFPRNHTKRTVAPSSGSKEMLDDRSIDDQRNTSIVVSSRHPPKKYNTHSSLDTTDASPSKHNKFTVQGVTNHSAKISHKFRKNMNLSRKIVAIHFDGDRSKASGSDYYAGNGRIRHGGSTFKAWKPSDWVNDLGMGEYFSMSDDGNVTIYETGLYLVYAQIHYNDDHDEIGFHLVVNGRPILQCMIDNSGHSRNISQTCFSAQLTRLKKQDVLVFKEASSPRFAIFDKENSFFGLVKLGELRRPSQ